MNQERFFNRLKLKDYVDCSKMVLNEVYYKEVYMKVYKTRQFNDWAKDESVSDKDLLNTIDEMEQGLKGASLGGSIYKKRMSIGGGRGNSGGARVIVAYVAHDRSFFIYGFSKNEIENITEKQEKILKGVSKQLISYSDLHIQHAIKQGALFEVKSHDSK